MLNRFILAGGIPSSGSTLLSSLLDGHGEICSGPETSLFCDPELWNQGPATIAAILNGRDGGTVPWGIPDENNLKFYGRSLESVARMAEQSDSANNFVTRFFHDKRIPGVVIDKTPQNIYAMNAFLGQSPENRAILTIRSADAVIDSLSRRGIEPRICAAVWLFDATLAYLLTRRYPEQTLLVRYEDLVAQPQKTLTNLCAFIAVEPDIEDMLQRRHSARSETDSSITPNGSNAASAWRFQATGEINAAGLDVDHPIPSDLKALVLDGVAMDGAIQSYCEFEGELPNGRTLHKFFGFKVPSGKYELVDSPVLDRSEVLSRYERFYLGKLRVVMPGNEVRLKFAKHRIVLTRKTISLVIRIVNRFDILVKKSLGFVVSTINRLLALPDLFKRFFLWTMRYPIKVFRYLTGFPGRGLRWIARLAARLQLSGYLSRKSAAVSQYRDRLVGNLEARWHEADSRRRSPVATYSRVPLPKDKYDVVGVIAFQGRNEILSVIVREALKPRKEGLSAGVVLACSNDADVNFANAMRAEHEDVGIVMTENKPLGRKWQRAVDCARLANPDFVYITGSDDVISSDFISRNVALMKRREVLHIAMSGPRSWFLFDLVGFRAGRSIDESLWQISYHNHFHLMPLGAGRIYSAEFLDSVDWQIFEQSWDKLLDDKGYNLVMEQNGAIYNPTFDDGFIMSVKGPWGQMNSLDGILKADSILAEPATSEQFAAILESLGESWDLVTSIAVSDYDEDKAELILESEPSS